MGIFSIIIERFKTMNTGVIPKLSYGQFYCVKYHPSPLSLLPHFVAVGIKTEQQKI